MKKTKADKCLAELQRLYPAENIKIKEMTRGDWHIFIPNKLFTPVNFKDCGIESAVRLKRPEELAKE